MRRLVILLSFMTISLISHAQVKPLNVVIILADDLGWNDTSIYQANAFYETPNIDALAERGMVFTESYTNSPLCSPTRATLLSGQTPARHQILNPNIETAEVRLTATEKFTGPGNQKSATPLTATRFDTSIPSLATILKANNYQTAHFGKWHIGPEPFSALQHGFDTDIPHYEGSGPTGGYLAPWSFAPNLQPQTPGEHIDIRLAEEASKWMSNHHDEGPLFINFWPFSVHAPFLNAEGDYFNHFAEKRSAFNSQRSAVYASMIKYFDDAIGILWNGLVDAGIEDETIIIFTSDNGGNMYDVLGQIHPTSNFPLRGGKATQYSGGNKVPTFVIWPGKSQPHTITREAIQTVDIYPTLLEELGYSWPASHTVDGINFSPALSGSTLPSRPIITYYPTRNSVPDWLPSSATILFENWKLIKTFHYGQSEQHMYQLFNLETDIEEKVNLAGQETAKLAELELMLDDYLTESGVALPQANTNYIDGRFNYSTLGKPGERYTLPEERTRKSFALDLGVSQPTASEGNVVEIFWEVSGDSSNVTTNYKQFMGPDVAISSSSNSIQFVAPPVGTEQFVAFAFISRVNDKIIRKQIAVNILPTNVSPRLDVQTTGTLRKGQTGTVSLTAYDANKDVLQLTVTSSALGLENVQSDSLETFSFEVPASLNSSQVDMTFKLSDGQETVIVKQSLSVAAGQTDTPPRTDSGSGGGGIAWLIPLSAMILLLRQKKRPR